MLAALATSLVAGSARGDPPPLRAHRGTPTVDGRLDDPAWRVVSWSEAFAQREPTTGARGTHTTRARVLYDDSALYVAVECEAARRPDARLGRRDAIPTGESLRLLIDARGEGAGAFSFSTNPAGVQADGVVAADGSEDTAWDAVWDVEVAVHPGGWRAEFRIPWRVLRFDAAQPDVRVQVERRDFESQETSALVPVPPDTPRYVARFLPVLGITGIRAARVFELRPYVLGRWRMFTDPARLDTTPTLSGSLGGDLKFGITNDLVLDATANPDFGQVEVDPAVINLSTFEVFFPERRPFFLEGTDIFRTPIQLLHTRRIGGVPGAPSPLRPNGEIDSMDSAATVWGAVKLTGRIGPVTIGLLDAVTAPVLAHERWTDAMGASQREARVVQPITNWLALRARTSFARGSTAGALMTHVGRVGQPHDVVGGVDWDLRAPDGIHRFSGQFAASQAWNASQGEHAGQALFAEVARAEDPRWLWFLRLRAYSRDFDPNGLGYLDRPDQVRVAFDTTFRTARPVGPFRSAYINPWIVHSMNTAGLVIDQVFGLDVGMTGQNQWSLGAGGIVRPGRWDDRETRGGFPYYLTPSMEAWAWIDSDPRGALRGGIWADMNTQNGGHRANAGLWLTWNATTFLTLSLNTTLRIVGNVPRWVANEPRLDGTTRAVFGEQRAEILDTTLRTGVAFSRRATLDVFSQLLVGAVRYDRYFELLSPDTLVPYGYAYNADYDRVSLTVNAVARYEYRAGSFFTLVFVHRSALVSGPGSPGYGEGLGMLGVAAPDDVLMAKLTYLVM